MFPLDPRFIRLALYAAAAVAVAMVLWLAWGAFTTWVRAPVVAQLEATRGQLADCAREKQALGAALARQSAAVDRMAIQARELAQRADKAVLEARKTAEKAYREADQLVRAKPLDADPCRSAELRAREFIAQRRR